MNRKEYENKTIDKIDQSQLAHTNNDVSVYDRVDDLPKDFAKLDDVTIGTKGESEFPLMSEMDRFCKQHEIPESAKIQGDKTMGMTKTAQTDDVAGEQ